MKLTFKDVGQGDSILLEWKKKGVEKVGIIDCNKKGQSNPIKEFIDESAYIEIDFIVLSHPHLDHYSGMVELLDLIEKKGLTLNVFAHTLHHIGSDYRKLNRVELDTSALKTLRELILKVDLLKKSGVIKRVVLLSENSVIPLIDNDTYLKCLSPGDREAERYMELVDLEPLRKTKEASSSANYLSTFFKLSVGDTYYLLTSDCESLTFERLVEERSHENLQLKQLKICQLPHHGSSNNHSPLFWDSITKSDYPNAVISAGTHGTYKHPHMSVLADFGRRGYKIYSTNIVHGMSDYINYLNSTSSSLNSFSELVYCPSGGDQTFELL